MNISGSPQQKKSGMFSSSRSPQYSHNGTSQSSRSCCRGLTDCMIIGPTTQHQPPALKLGDQQLVRLAELEKEVEKQKELKAMFKMRLDKTQEYLKCCLQVAQENGFLDIIIDNKNNHKQHHLSSDIIHENINPPLVHHHQDLAALINQAKMNGWYIDPHEIELDEKIANGSTAYIYRGKWRGLDVAVKCINPEFFHSNECGVSFFAQEVETLSRQRHRFVLQLMGACLNPPDYGWIVTEFLGMTLKEWLHGPGKRQRERIVPLPSFLKRLNKALEIAQAMQYLHEHKPKVIHRDLKPSNIFLDDAMHVRVADFGHARFLNDEEKALTGEIGTYVYMAPEVIRCEPYNEKCDVYSFGIILNELVTGEYPYMETDYGPSRIALDVAEGKLRPKLPKDDDHHQLEELIELIQLLWDENTVIRPSFAAITHSLRKIEHKFIDTI